MPGDWPGDVGAPIMADTLVRAAASSLGTTSDGYGVWQSGATLGIPGVTNELGIINAGTPSPDGAGGKLTGTRTYMSLLDLGTCDVDIYLTTTGQQSGVRTGLVARADPSLPGYYRFLRNLTGTAYVLEYVNATHVFTHFTFPRTVFAGDRLRMHCEADAWTLYVKSITDPAFVFLTQFQVGLVIPLWENAYSTPENIGHLHGIVSVSTTASAITVVSNDFDAYDVQYPSVGIGGPADPKPV